MGIGLKAIQQTQLIILVVLYAMQEFLLIIPGECLIKMCQRYIGIVVDVVQRWKVIVLSDTDKKKPRKRQSKNYESLIGQKFSMLTIQAILPRERDSYGDLRPPRCRCICECGNTTVTRLYDVVNYNIVSCGCIRGKHGVDRDSNTPESIIDALAAIYYCSYPTTTCVRSGLHHLCCHECDRYDNCPQACMNTPEKCKAKLRDDMRNSTDTKCDNS